MTTLEIGKQLVAMCQQGQNIEAVKALYHPEIVSVEAMAMPTMPQEVRGRDAVLGKNTWWVENHEVHSATVEGPFPNGDRFAVRFAMDITNKLSKQRSQMTEIAIYTVANDKIVREEFFYVT